MNEGQLWMTIGADNTQFAKAANDTNRKLSDMSNNVKAFSSSIKTSFAEAAKQMAGFYSVAKAGSLFTDLINKNDAFNKSMREVSTLSEDVAKNLESYKKQILEMTTEIPIAADDAAKALYQINSAGHTGADGMTVLEASAKAAIGGVTDTATAADTITTVLNAYKLSSNEATEVSDKLFTAVRLGKTTMSELGQSIAEVAPMAATYGISIDQVLAAVATLTKNGTPTAQAFTQIRAAIVGMSDAMGATYFQTHTLQQGMVELRAAVPDNNKLKDTMGRIEGVNAVLAMTGKNANGAAADLKEFQNSAGAAGAAYDKMNTGKGVELTKLQNNIMAEMAGLNDEISNTIASLAHSLNEAFDSGAIDSFVSSLEELITAYGVYKAMAIAVSAYQSAQATIMATLQTQEIAQEDARLLKLQEVIAMKQAEVTEDGQVTVAEEAQLTAREQAMVAAQQEAEAVVAGLKAKAQEAAMNLEVAKSEENMALAQVQTAETGIAMREKDLEAAIATGDGIKIENAERELNIACMDKEDAARTLSNAQRKTELAQIEATNTAKVAEAASTGLNTAAEGANTAATTGLAKAKTLLSVAINKVKTALLANPYTVALAAVVALGYGIYKLIEYFKDEQDRLKGVTGDLDKYGRTADEVKQQNDDLTKTYTDANAQITESMAKLKAFSGSKEDEKKLVQECNDKYGDAMGYYSSVADWYKVLSANSKLYCMQLVNEAKMRQLANQAAENDKKIHDIKYNEDGTQKLYDTDRKTDFLSGMQIAGTSDQEIATNDIKNLRNANKSIQQQMQAIAKEQQQYAAQLSAGVAGTTQVNKPGSGKATINTKSTGGSGKTKEQIAAEVAEAHQSLLDLLDKQATERQRKEQDDADALLALQISTMKESAAKRVAQLRLDHDNELKELDREEEDEIEKEIERQKAVFDAQENENAKGKKKYAKKTFTDDNIDQTAITAIQGDYQAQRENIFKKQKKELKDLGESELAKEREFLKQYGTIQQQRLAIKEDYDKQIADAEEYQKPGLKAEQNRVLADFDNKALEDQINQQIATNPIAIKAHFDMSSLSGEEMASLRAQTEEWGAALQGLPTEQLQMVNDLINSLDAQLIANNPFEAFAEGKEELAQANKEIETYTAEVEEAKNELKAAQENENAEAVGKAQAKLTKATNKLTSAQNKSVKADKKMRASKGQVSEIINGLGGDIQQVGDIVGNFSDDAGKFISGIGNLVSSVGNAMKVTSADTVSSIKAIESASAILAIISAVIQLATAAASLLGFGKDDSEYEAAKQEYDALVDVWDQLIDRKKEYLSESWGSEVEQTKEEAEQLYKNETEAAQYAAQQRLSAGSSAGSRSYGYRMWKGSYKYQGQNWRDVAGEIDKQLGTNMSKNGMSEFTTMTADQLKWIQENYTGLWSQMDGDFKDLMEDVIEYGENAEDFIEECKDQLTQTSFDGMYDNFIDTLMDMDSDAEDFSDDLSETMMKSLLSNQVGQAMKSNLQKWYDAYADALEKGNGKLTDAQIAQFKSDYNDIVAEGIQMRDNLAKVSGVDSSEDQEATANGIESITADQADQLVGRITAMQIAVEATNDSMGTAIVEIASVAALQTQGNAYLSDILNQQALANSYLEDITKYSKAMYLELDGKMQKIVDYTSKI